MALRDRFAADLRDVRSRPLWQRLTVAVGMVALSFAVAAVILGVSPLHTGVSLFDLAASMTVALAMFAGLAVYIQRHGMAGEGIGTILVWFVDLKLPGARGLALAVGTTLATATGAGLAELLGRLLREGETARHTAAATAGGAGVDPATLATVFVLAVVIGPVLEELLFRNGIQKVASEWLGVPGAILATSVVFALFHVPSYGGLSVGAIAPLLSVFLAAVLYGAVYAWTENVAVAMLAHGMHNALALLTVV